MIATTSSEEKSKLLHELGADVVINYRTTPEWGPVAKKASPGGLGVDHVIEIGNSPANSFRVPRLQQIETNFS